MDEWRNGEIVNERGTGVPTVREGDIVITRVAHHYSLGRVSADNQTQTSLESHDHRAEAIRRACAVAGADQQVFIYEEAESSARVLVYCETLAGDPNDSSFTADDLSPAPVDLLGEIANPQSLAWKGEQTELGTVAIFSASDDTVAMIQALLTEARGNQSLIQCPFADLKRGITDFRKYLDQHNPEVVIFDISPPYAENWAFFATVRDHAVMQGRGVVLTTTSKMELDELAREELYALEVVGGLVDRALILAEIKTATRLARTARRQAISASIAPVG